jgi:hypothetical protein
MKSQDLKASECASGARNAGRPVFKRLVLPLAIWLALPGLARAEDSAPSVLQSIPVLAKPAAAPAQPGETVTEELIRLLADRFALSQEDANRLIKRLRDEQAQAAAKADTSPAALAAAQPPAAATATTEMMNHSLNP